MMCDTTIKCRTRFVIVSAFVLGLISVVPHSAYAFEEIQEEINSPFPVFGKIVHVDSDHHPVKEDKAIGYYTRTICNRLKDYESPYLVCSKVKKCSKEKLEAFESAYVSPEVGDTIRDNSHVLLAIKRMDKMKEYLSYIYKEYYEYGFGTKPVRKCRTMLNKACTNRFYWAASSYHDTPRNDEVALYNKIGDLLDKLDDIHRSEFRIWQLRYPRKYARINKKFQDEIEQSEIAQKRAHKASVEYYLYGNDASVGSSTYDEPFVYQEPYQRKGLPDRYLTSRYAQKINRYWLAGRKPRHIEIDRIARTIAEQDVPGLGTFDNECEWRGAAKYRDNMVLERQCEVVSEIQRYIDEDFDTGF